MGYFFQSNKGLKRVKRRLKKGLTLKIAYRHWNARTAGLRYCVPPFPLNLFPVIKIYLGVFMDTVRKDIRGLNPEVLDVIEKRAKQEGVTSNDLLRELITNYARQIEEDSAAKILHTYLDDLIMANNNVVHGLNDNTIAIGEMFKTILARLEMYFPDLNDEVERIQKNARPQEKNLSKSIDFDEFE